MAQTKTSVGTPVWVDLAATDAAAERAFYEKLFGWNVEVNPDPQYGGYGLAKVGGQDAAGIGPKQDQQQPSAWSLYIGTEDAAETVKKVQAAGGTVIAPPFPVGDQGTMAVFQDPAGAFISVWQPNNMSGFQSNAAGAFAWAELNARGIDKAKPFYTQVFGWGEKVSPMGEGMGDYTEFQVGGHSILGGTEMSSMVPAEVPSHWLVYFGVTDVDKKFDEAIAAGGKELLSPQDFPGGRFAILADPEGAAFGILRMQQE